MTHLDVVHMEICGVVLPFNKLQVRTAGSARCACGPLQAHCVMTPTPTVTGQSRTPGIFFFCFPPPTLKGGKEGRWVRISCPVLPSLLLESLRAAAFDCVR